MANKVMAVQTESFEELRALVRDCPVIDNHGHNLLRPSGQKSADLLTITTEASGVALRDTPTTLAHIRALRQLRRLYDLPDDADWAALLAKRNSILEQEHETDSFYRKCFGGTQTILIDDGLA